MSTDQHSLYPAVKDALSSYIPTKQAAEQAAIYSAYQATFEPALATANSATEYTAIETTDSATKCSALWPTFDSAYQTAQLSAHGDSV